jgi:hypothetical protein
MIRNLEGSIYGRSSKDYSFRPDPLTNMEVVSEEKIFLEINQSVTRIVCGGHVC